MRLLHAGVFYFELLVANHGEVSLGRTGRLLSVKRPAKPAWTSVRNGIAGW